MFYLVFIKSLAAVSESVDLPEQYVTEDRTVQQVVSVVAVLFIVGKIVPLLLFNVRMGC